MSETLQTALTDQNYSKGFLIDSEWIGGVAPDPQSPENFIAYVVEIATAKTLGVHKFDSLEKALVALNKIPRTWSFESTSGCANGNCEAGNCATKNDGQGMCPKFSKSLKSAQNEKDPQPTSSCSPC